MPRESYRLTIRSSARKELTALPTHIGEQVQRDIARLVERLDEGKRPQDVKPLKGHPNTFRLSSGEYRVIFLLDDPASMVTIIRIRHRKDAYRNL